MIFYLGLFDSISKMPNYEDLPKKQGTEYLESWKVDDGLDVELRMSILGDQSSIVSVTYKVTPEEWNK